jgi:hypothetical protein
MVKINFHARNGGKLQPKKPPIIRGVRNSPKIAQQLNTRLNKAREQRR